MPLQYRAVLFDLYETLITHFDPDWVPGPSVAERLRVDEFAFSEVWSQMSSRRMVGAIEDYPHALREALRALGGTIDDIIIRQLTEERIASHRKPFERINAEVLSMLRQLQRGSLKLGLLSNATPDGVLAWDDCVLSQFFDDVVFSYRVGLAKPDVQVYDVACEHLEVPPASTAFVGDGAHNELRGAAEAGLTPYWATWFLESWPDWEERAAKRGAPHVCRIRSPAEVVKAIGGCNTG